MQFTKQICPIVCTVYGGAVGAIGVGVAMAPPDLALFQPEGRLCPSYHYWPPRIFRPSYGPVCCCLWGQVTKRARGGFSSIIVSAPRANYVHVCEKSSSLEHQASKL